ANAARRTLKTNAIDLAVLDVMMPGEDGLSLCRSLNSESTLPVIFLTARSSDVDRILGLEMGADDYIAKPFNPRELVARIAARLDRAGGAAASFRPMDVGYGAARAAGARGHGRAAQRRRLSVADRVSRAAQHRPLARSVARPCARAQRRAVRPQHRQRGQPAS